MSKLLKEIPDSIGQYLQSMDDYDDPCFVLVHVEQDIGSLLGAIESVVDAEKTYEKTSIPISNNLYFMSIDCTHNTMLSIIEKIHASMIDSNVITHTSVFRHNCLGNPKNTFSWCCLLLDEVRDTFTNGCGYKINDFKDRDNWPGIGKYLEA